MAMYPNHFLRSLALVLVLVIAVPAVCAVGCFLNGQSLRTNAKRPGLVLSVAAP